MEEARQILAVLSDVYGLSPWTLEQIEADLAQESTHYFYVSEGQEVLGFLAIQNLAGEREITNIAVKRAYQGKGLASQLLQNIASCPEPIFLEVREGNVAARKLYEKHDFKEIGRRKQYYHNPVEDAVLMMRSVQEKEE